MSCRHGPAGQHLAGRFLWPSWTLWPCKVRETLKCLEMLDILLDMFLGGSSFYQVVVPNFLLLNLTSWPMPRAKLCPSRWGTGEPSRLSKKWLCPRSKHRTNFECTHQKLYRLVVYLPLWKIWVRQLGWFFPTKWTVINFHGSSHHQPWKIAQTCLILLWNQQFWYGQLC